MQALQRLAQKNIKMEIKLRPLTLQLRGSSGELNDGQPCEVQIQIIRGPETFTSGLYHVTPEAKEVIFSEEEFKKNSGFYFSKDGPEYKKATFNVLKKFTVNGKDETNVLTSTDINLSSLISNELKDSRIEFGKSGILALSMLASVSPVNESDRAFITTFLASADTERPALQTPSNAGQHKHRNLRDIFAGAAHGEQDQLNVVREVKELETREKAQEDQI